MTLAERQVLELLKKRSKIDCYQYSIRQWQSISKALQSLKRKGMVYSRKEKIYGGISGRVLATVWRPKGR